MELLKEKSLHQLAVQITEDLKNSASYEHFYEEMQKLVTCQNVKCEEFKETFVKTLQENGYETKLSNSVFYWIRNNSNTHVSGEDTESFFKKYQSQWDKRIYKSLNSMCSEIGIALAKMRSPAERDELIEKWGELSNYDVDIHKYRPVYAPKDFLDVLLGLKTPQYKHKMTENTPTWQFSYLPLRVKLLPELRILYQELARGEPLLGMNLPSHSWSPNYSLLEAERIELGEKVWAQHRAPVAQEYLKKGCPRSLRSKLWSLVMDSEINQTHYDHFHYLRESVLQYDLMIDKLIIKDIHLTASNDDQYFVYEDVLYQVMLCFSRDNEVMHALSSCSNLMHVVLKGKIPIQENSIIFPPSGVIPFHGFSMFAAPLCYLYDNPVQLYFTFRAFYLRYWYRLHRVCSHSQGIVALCLLYERLLQCYEPTLWHHFKKLQVHPLRVVFKWLMRAFSGHLPPEQLLYLWDLVLAYDSLEIIPLLAVSILSFRKPNLMKVDNLQSIEAVLADLSSVAVMPLLQMALIAD